MPSSDLDLEGWSRGYVEFVWDDAAQSLRPWTSPDGRNWSAGKNLATGTWEAELANARTSVPDMSNPDLFSGCFFLVSTFQEGPSDLLLVGYLYCPLACGDHWDTSLKVWVSPDGLDWSALDPEALKALDPRSISGGSSGFIARGSTGEAIRLSSDGLTWKDGSLPQLGPQDSVKDPVSFASGFALPGAVLETAGDEPSPGTQNCSGGGSTSPRPPLYVPAVWWSADGSNWTRETLPGTSPSERVDISIERLGDHALLATAHTDASEPLEWVSADGRNWRAVDWGSSASSAGKTLTDGRRSLVGDGLGFELAQVRFFLLGPNLDLIPLEQTGLTSDMPVYPNSGEGAQIALGPAGLLMTDGPDFWLGTITLP
jgi:hypothetical protein